MVMNKLLPGFVQRRERKANQPHHFLGAFAKLRNVTISFAMSIRPSVGLSACNNSADTGRTSMQLDI
jgi:hypothetical protein